jgi:DNA-directed RNA polymerase specialized sigma24 family protein
VPIAVESAARKQHAAGGGPRTVDLLALEEAMDRLKQLAPQAERMAELKIFGGVTTREAAEALEIPYSQARREWDFAKGWLKARLELE